MQQYGGGSGGAGPPGQGMLGMQGKVPAARPHTGSGQGATGQSSASAQQALPNLPQWDDAEIAKRLEMNEILLDEWHALMERTANLPADKLNVNDCMKHHVLVS